MQQPGGKEMKTQWLLLTALGVTVSVVCGCADAGTNEGNGKQGASVHAQSATQGLEKSPHDIPGYRTFLEDGRLWVFREGSEDLAKFREHGEPAKIVVLPGKGPGGMTLKGTDRDTMLEYALSKPGFAVFLEDGRLWVFREGSEDLTKFRKHGEPAKIVVLPGKGPGGMTLKSVDRIIIDAYLAARQ
jgi:hypothetical protein